jgi:hypothetical protein
MNNTDMLRVMESLLVLRKKEKIQELINFFKKIYYPKIAIQEGCLAMKLDKHLHPCMLACFPSYTSYSFLSIIHQFLFNFLPFSVFSRA